MSIDCVVLNGVPDMELQSDTHWLEYTSTEMISLLPVDV